MDEPSAGIVNVVMYPTLLLFCQAKANVLASTWTKEWSPVELVSYLNWAVWVIVPPLMVKVLIQPPQAVPPDTY